MTKTGKQLIMTGVLLVVLALTLVNSLSKVKREGQGKKAETVEVSETEKKNEKKEKGTSFAKEPAAEEVLSEQKERLDIEWGRDPFYAEEQKEETLRDVEEKETTEISHFSLKGILWTSERPIALINTQTVTEGELILGYKVVDIQKDKVILRKGDKEYELSIEE